VPLCQQCRQQCTSCIQRCQLSAIPTATTQWERSNKNNWHSNYNNGGGYGGKYGANNNTFGENSGDNQHFGRTMDMVGQLWEQ